MENDFIGLYIQGNGRDKIIRKLIYFSEDFYLYQANEMYRLHNLPYYSSPAMGNNLVHNKQKYLANTESICKRYLWIKFKLEFIGYLKIRYGNKPLNYAVVEYIKDTYNNKTRKYYICPALPYRKFTKDNENNIFIQDSQYYNKNIIGFDFIESKKSNGFTSL